jgi:hypothetical protein
LSLLLLLLRQMRHSRSRAIRPSLLSSSVVGDSTIANCALGSGCCGGGRSTAGETAEFLFFFFSPSSLPTRS